MTTSGQTATFGIAWCCVWNAAVSRHSGPTSFRFGHAAISTALPNSLTSLTRPDRIGWQRVDVHFGMLYQRDCFLGRVGSDESVAV